MFLGRAVKYIGHFETGDELVECACGKQFWLENTLSYFLIVSPVVASSTVLLHVMNSRSGLPNKKKIQKQTV